MTAVLSKLRISNYFTCLINWALPNRTKRLLFLTSLASRFINMSNFNKETMHKLNSLLKLCNNERAMELPIALSNIIWHGKTSMELCHCDVCNVELSKELIKEMTSNILSLVPTWLKYSEDEDIKHDVEILLRNSRMLVA
jgi:hypothetical protein